MFQISLNAYSRAGFIVLQFFKLLFSPQMLEILVEYTNSIISAPYPRVYNANKNIPPLCRAAEGIRHGKVSGGLPYAPHLHDVGSKRTRLADSIR